MAPGIACGLKLRRLDVRSESDDSQFGAALDPRQQPREIGRRGIEIDQEQSRRRSRKAFGNDLGVSDGLDSQSDGLRGSRHLAREEQVAGEENAVETWHRL